MGNLVFFIFVIFFLSGCHIQIKSRPRSKPNRYYIDILQHQKEENQKISASEKSHGKEKPKEEENSEKPVEKDPPKKNEERAQSPHLVVPNDGRAKQKENTNKNKGWFWWMKGD